MRHYLLDVTYVLCGQPEQLLIHALVHRLVLTAKDNTAVCSAILAGDELVRCRKGLNRLWWRGYRGGDNRLRLLRRRQLWCRAAALLHDHSMPPRQALPPATPAHVPHVTAPPAAYVMSPPVISAPRAL